MAAIATAHQRYLTTDGTIVKSQPPYYTAHSSRDISHTSRVGPTSEPCNHYGFANRRALQSEHSNDSNCPHDNHH